MATAAVEETRHFNSLEQATVFIVDDDADLRQAIAMLVRSVDLRAQVFASARDFLDGYEASRPGCLLLDMRMPGMTGLQLQRHLAEKGWQIPIIFVTAHGEVATAATAMRAGAVDYIPKPFSSEYLLERIHEAIELDRRTRRLRQLRDDVDSRVAALTQREQQVMHLLVQGQSTKVIAARLGISQKTVDNHRAKVLEKMSVDNAAQLASAFSRLN